MMLEKKYLEICVRIVISQSETEQNTKNITVQENNDEKGVMQAVKLLKNDKVS